MSESDQPTIKVLDVSDAINKGVGLKVGQDLIIGPVKDKPAPPDEWRWLREPQVWTAEPPQGTDGKVPMQFQLTEKCGVKEKGKPACRLNLIVARVKEVTFETDENQGGGQLNYDEKNISQWKYCPRHGPFPAGPYEKVGGKWQLRRVEKVVV